MLIFVNKLELCDSSISEEYIFTFFSFTSTYSLFLRNEYALLPLIFMADAFGGFCKISTLKFFNILAVFN